MRVSQPRGADDNYNASAASAPFPVTLKKANQTTAVVVTAPAMVTYGTTGTAAASGGDGTGAYSFSVGVSTGCSVIGTTVSVTDASGTCALTATRESDNDYNAWRRRLPVTLNKATQTALSLTVPASVTYGATGNATTLGGSGTGALTFSAGASTGCSVDASTGVISVSNASGTCSISASKAGDNNYNGPVSDDPRRSRSTRRTRVRSW